MDDEIMMLVKLTWGRDPTAVLIGVLTRTLQRRGSPTQSKMNFHFHIPFIKRSTRYIPLESHGLGEDQPFIFLAPRSLGSAPPLI
jgi:hypothetical protein